MQPKKKIWPISAFLLLGLSGCGTNDETALQDKRTQETTPIGYYSNERHEGNGGNAILLDGADNDGPATEIMDHTMGVERETNRGFLRVNKTRENHPDNLKPLANRDADNIDSRSVVFGATDKNYHGQIDNSNLPTRQSYYTDYEGKIVERIKQAAQNVENVNKASAVVYGKDVVIGIRVENGVQEEETKSRVLQAVRPHLEGRSGHIVTNESQYNRIETLDNDIRLGREKEMHNEDIKNLIHSISNNNQ